MGDVFLIGSFLDGELEFLYARLLEGAYGDDGKAEEFPELLRIEGETLLL